MRKIILLLAFLACELFAQQEMSLGMVHAGAGVVTSLALNAAASGGYSQAWLAFGFIPQHTSTITDVWVHVSAATASLGASDLVCDIYSDSAGLPLASISTTHTVEATPTGAAWVHFESLNASVTAGTQYFIVLRNANATPTTQYPTYQWAGAFAGNVFAGSSGITPGFFKINSANGGSTWAGTFTYNTAGWLLGYTGGIYEGYPVSATGATSATKVFSTAENGFAFTTGGSTINVVGASLWFRHVGTPPNAVTVSLLNGVTSVASSTIPEADIPSAGPYLISVRWPVVTLAANTLYRVVISTSAGDASNYYQYGQEDTLLNLAGARAILPFGGFYNTYCPATCGTAGNWTTTNTLVDPGAIILAPGSEFPAQSGGTGAASYPIGQL